MSTDDDVNDFLEHYGVKGMKWGVRNENKSTTKSKSNDNEKKVSDSSAKDRYLNALKRVPKPSPSERTSNLANSQEKFNAKFGDAPKGQDADSKKGWRPTKKQAAYAVAGAVLVGAVIYGNKYYNPKPGEPLSAKQFNAVTQMSKLHVWPTMDFVTPDAIANSVDITLPKGHTFYRLSTVKEDTYSSYTYATSNRDDFNRYVTAFRHEKGSFADKFYETSFKAKTDIKVPGMVTKLETMKEVLRQSGLNNPTDDEAIADYKMLVGGDWSSGQAKAFVTALKVKGYTGILDDMDAGVIGDSPLVLFGQSDVFTNKKAKVLNQEAIKVIESSVKELSNRRRRDKKG